MRKQAIVGLVGSLGLIGSIFATGSAGAAAASGSGASDEARVCGAPQAGTVSCNAIQLLNPSQNWRGSHVAPSGHGGTTSSTTGPNGFHPADLQSAYNLGASSVSPGAETVAIVDAYDDPNAYNDVSYYRAQVQSPALPALNQWTSSSTSGPWFKKVNQNGTVGSYPRGSGSWAEEISLDLDMVSAICPNCNILLVEASSNSYANLGTAVNYAAGHANAVSNSYGGSDSSSDSSYDKSYCKHSGVVITASSGDSGYGVEYPAASQYVTAVGGTSLSVAAGTPRGWAETAWSSAGSGCSKYEPNPGWQPAVTNVCTSRTVADVSADADPNTGVAVYDTYHEPGWLVFGGTSVASPIIASVYALAGHTSTDHYGQQPYTSAGTYWSTDSNGNAVPGTLNDVTSGANGSCGGTYLCTAGTAYDGPTGLGTPWGTGAF